MQRQLILRQTAPPAKSPAGSLASAATLHPPPDLSGFSQPSTPIAPQLKPHLVRWRKHSARWVIEYEGARIARKLRRSWHSARKLAGLGADVLPHTCATWLLQEGESVHDVGGVLGTSEDVIRSTYGHHAHDGLRRTVEAFSRR